jgi:hypothetical protein
MRSSCAVQQATAAAAADTVHVMDAGFSSSAAQGMHAGTAIAFMAQYHACLLAAAAAAVLGAYVPQSMNQLSRAQGIAHATYVWAASLI